MDRTENEIRRRPGPLLSQLVWFVRLRWLAGLGLVGGGLTERFWLEWYGRGTEIVVAGGVVLAYNAGLWALLKGGTRGRSRGPLVGLAWLQILADLACLSCLTVWTGGYGSPLVGLYALHMVFASLLLPRAMAFAVAGVAIAMLEGGLALVGRLPGTREGIMWAVGWGMGLLLTVYLAGHITAHLRRQRRRLVRQNRRIRAMTRRLRQQQQALVQQEKMVAMGQMAAGVAHEVANPLASMDGLLQLMERKPEKVTPENLARLREQVARITAIVRQLTTFAHPEDGEWREGTVNAVVDKALEVLRFDRRLKDVTVVRELAANVPGQRMLAGALEQVVINLVINAVDAMAEVQDKRLVVRTGSVGGTGSAATFFEVEDNGTGLAAEIRERIFEPFFTTKPVGKGTGLGLSISYSMVRKHGGTIEVKSEVGKGAAFRVVLPRGMGIRSKSVQS